MKRGVREGRKALAVTLLGLLLLALPLETRGLRAWAERLDVGGLRTLALDASERLSALTERTRLPAARTALLDAVATFPSGAGGGRLAEAEKSPLSPPQPAIPVPVQQVKQAGTSSSSGEAGEVRTGPVVDAVPLVKASKPASPQDADAPSFTVALVGDSMMAVSLGPYLARELSTLPGVRVIRAYRSGTGLARPEVFNWLEQYPKLVGSNRPDLIVCAIGANDAQNFMLDGKPVAFGSETWNREYQRRVESLVNEAAPGDTPVLWLALPSMRSEKFAKRVLELNEVVKARLSQKESVAWMESNPLLGGGKADYVEFQKNSKQKLERLRQADGIHLSDAGAARIGSSIVAWVMQHRNYSRSPQGSSISADL